MKHPAFGIIKGVYDALNGNITYDGNTIPIYSTMPQGVDGYYIYISAFRNTEDYTKTTFGGRVRFDVKITTPTLENNGSKLPLYNITSQVTNLLRPTRLGNLTIQDDLTNKLFYLEDSRELEDLTPEGKVYQVVLSWFCEYEEGESTPAQGGFTSGFSNGFD